jgi:hypothetical protein
MRKHKIYALILAILMMALAVGCTAGNSDEGGTADPGVESTESAENADEQETMTESPSEASGTDINPSDTVTDVPSDTDEMQGNTIKLQIGETVWTATLVDNSSTQALKELLVDGPVTIDMQDYGNMEKVGGIGTSLPTNDEQITTEPGDLILFQASALVIYYEPNSWNFTRLGKIDDVTQEELKDVLGSGDVTVTLSLEQD